MRSRKLLAMALCGVMAASVAAPAFADSSVAEAAADRGGQTIGIAMPTQSLERWNRDGSFLDKQFQAAG